MSEDFAIGPPVVNTGRKRPREQPVLNFGRIRDNKSTEISTRIKFNPLSIDERYDIEYGMYWTAPDGSNYILYHSGKKLK